MREGTDEAALFFHLLLDEPDEQEPAVTAGTPASGGTTPQGSSAGSGTTAQFGLVQFLEHIRLEVVSALKAEAQASPTPGGGAAGR